MDPQALARTCGGIRGTEEVDLANDDRAAVEDKAEFGKEGGRSLAEAALRESDWQSGGAGCARETTAQSEENRSRRKARRESM